MFALVLAVYVLAVAALCGCVNCTFYMLPGDLLNATYLNLIFTYVSQIIIIAISAVIKRQPRSISLSSVISSLSSAFSPR